MVCLKYFQSNVRLFRIFRKLSFKLLVPVDLPEGVSEKVLKKKDGIGKAVYECVFCGIAAECDQL